MTKRPLIKIWRNEDGIYQVDFDTLQITKEKGYKIMQDIIGIRNKNAEVKK